jgi:phosphatidate cytidylyltransferase
MSPQAALHSEIFRAYFLIMAAVLIIAGLVLSVLRWGLKKNVLSIWATYQSWLIMAPLALGFIFAGRAPVIVFFCVLAALGFKEFARATGLYRDWWMCGLV